MAISGFDLASAALYISIYLAANELDSITITDSVENRKALLPLLENRSYLLKKF